MKIKIVLFIIIELPFSNIIFPQNIVDKLKQFYKDADMECYITQINRNINNYFILENKIWERDKFGIPPKKIELHEDEIIPMLTIQFFNTDSFDYDDDICNFICIDSSIVFTLAIVNKKFNVTAFAHFFNWADGYYEIDKDPSLKNTVEKKRLKHIIKNINKQKPEIILYSNVLCGFNDSNGFMYIKNGKIYVYRVIEKDTYELNEYLRIFFSLYRIRRLNYSYIPIIYQMDQSPRRTGYNSKYEKIICL